MAKFLNKKEQVFDIKLTSYGHYLLSVGAFKPVYYSFYDNNILYDPTYTQEASGSLPGPLSQSIDPRNSIQNRIKEDTPYIEGLVLFQEVEDLLTEITDTPTTFNTDLTPTQVSPRIDGFIYDTPIGDAYFSAKNNQFAPAWKVVSLAGEIQSCQLEESGTQSRIPQINIDSRYILKSVERQYNFDPDFPQDFPFQTRLYADEKVIFLEQNDVMLYVEEQNTEILTENFDIEVFQSEAISTDIHASGSITFLSNPSVTTPLQNITIQTWPAADSVRFQFKNSSGYNADTATDILIQGDVLTTLAETISRINAHPSVNVEAFFQETEDGLPSNTFDLINNVVGTKGNQSSGATILTNTPGKFAIVPWNGGTDLKIKYHRKYFPVQTTQVVDGYLVHDQASSELMLTASFTTSSVESFFTVEKDSEVPPEQACKGAETFNKSSYYVNLDFDCSEVEDTTSPVQYFDIYGKVTDTEICPD